MREIKFRAWIPDHKQMREVWSLDTRLGLAETKEWKLSYTDSPDVIVMQYTGLKDKNGLQEVYEGDIIDVEGNIKGNIYEINETDKDKFDLVIQGFGAKAWLTTYQNAVDRGCKDA